MISKPESDWLTNRLVEIQKLSTEQPVKDALGKLLLELLRAGGGSAITEHHRPPTTAEERFKEIDEGFAFYDIELRK